MTRAIKRRLDKAEKKGKLFTEQITLFKSCTIEEDKRWILSDWMIQSFEALASVKAETIKSLMIRLKYESELFSKSCFRIQQSPNIEWYLAENWFASVISQTMAKYQIDPIRQLFYDIWWDIDDAIAPKSDEVTTVEKFLLENVLNGCDKPVDIRLIQRGAVAVGSEWENVRSGLSWEIVGAAKGVCEMVSSSTSVVLFRKESDILRTFKKLA